MFYDENKNIYYVYCTPNTEYHREYCYTFFKSAIKFHHQNQKRNSFSKLCTFNVTSCLNIDTCLQCLNIVGSY